VLIVILYGTIIVCINSESQEDKIGDQYPKFKAAAVQTSPVFLNREATVDKAC